MRLLALATLFLFNAPSHADEGWINQQVMPKRGSPEISRTDENGNVIVLGKIDYYPVPVREEKGDWVKVQVRDVAGWVPKESLVRVADGISYFTERIQKKDALGEAFRIRARLFDRKGELDNAVKDADEAISWSQSLNPILFGGIAT